MNKTVSLKTIAQACGVSTSAVSLALSGVRGRISEPTRKRILACARELHYTGNPAARILRRQRTNMLTLVLPPYFSGCSAVPDFNAHIRKMHWEIICGIINQAAAHNYEVKLRPFFEHEKLEALLPALSRGYTDGCIFLHNSYFHELVPRLDIPALQAGITSFNLHSGTVYLDTACGYREAVAQLIVGHPQIRVGFVGQLPSDEPAEHGIRDYLQRILHELAPSVKLEDFKAGDLFDLIDLAQSGRLAEIDVLFCRNDAIADYLWRTYHKHHLAAMPHLVGYDHNPVWRSFDTIGYDRQLFAATAVDAILKMMQGQDVQPQAIPCHFIKAQGGHALA